MSTAGNLNQQSAQDLAIKYLKVLYAASEGREAVIEQYCSRPISSRNGVALNDLCNNATVLNNLTLVVTENPIEFFASNFEEKYVEILSQLKYSGANDESGLKMGVKSFSDWHSKYLKEVEKWKVTRDRFAESLGGRSAGRRAAGSNYVSPEDKLKEWHDRNPEPELSLPHNLMLAGVAVYAPTRLHRDYNSLVMDLMSKGQLVFVITDDDICYGTNYPIENIIADGTIMPRRSFNTLLQLCARAGRPGKSDRARIWLHDSLIAKFNGYIFDPAFDDIEFYNLNLAIANASANEPQQQGPVVDVEDVHAEVVLDTYACALRLLSIHKLNIQFMREKN